MVDAAVSKTVGSYIPCRFDSDLRHDVNHITKGRMEFPIRPCLFRRWLNLPPIAPNRVVDTCHLAFDNVISVTSRINGGANCHVAGDRGRGVWLSR